MSQQKSPRKRRILPLILWGLLILAGLFVLVVFGLWTARKGLMSDALGKYCAARGLVCTADIERIGLSGAELSNLIVSSSGAVPLKAAHIRVEYETAGFGVPAIGAIYIKAPELRVAHDGTRFELYGLEGLIPEAKGGGGPLPAIEITNGRLFIDTPAGELAASIALSGTLPAEGEARIQIDPATLQSMAGEVTLKKGLITLGINGQTVTGDADIDLETARFGGMAVRSLALKGSLQGQDGPAGPVEIDWQGAVAEANFPGGSTVDTSTSGVARLSHLPEFNRLSIQAALDAVSAKLDTGPVTREQLSASTLSAQIDLARKSDVLTGSVALGVTALETAQLAAGKMQLSGALDLPTQGGPFRFDGLTTFTQADISGYAAGARLGFLDVPAPFNDHGRALKRALLRAGKNFDAAIDAEVQFGDGAIMIKSRRPTSLQASSGLIASIRPKDQTHWLTYMNGSIEMRGQVAISGGGAPDLTMNLDEFSTGEAGLNLQARSIDLAPWQAGAKTLAADLENLKLSRKGKLTRAAALGQISVSGALPGVSLGATTLAGGVEAASDARGWRMQMLGQDCLDFVSQGLDFGAIEVEPVALKLCPEEGRFIRQSSGTPAGRILLGEIVARFKTQSGGGVLNLTGSAVDWSADHGLSMTIGAQKMDLPLIIGGRTLTISGQTPQISALAGDGPLRLTARLREVDFTGSLVPANVSAASFRFDGRSSENGMVGKLLGSGVRIADNHADPIYQPLIADFSADLKDRRLLMTGPVRLATGGFTIADTRLDIDIISLDGTASVRTRDLRFSENGLQPVMLSERLRGLFTYATGQVGGVADFTIRRGKLAATGLFAATDFGFQTTRFGRVDGVTGKVDFNDLLALTTPPGQAVTIDRINPGITLENGQIVFQLLGARSARLQAASFPFAGGQLFVSPATWTIGGDKQIVQVEVDKVELAEIINAVKVPDINASGTVSGRFPIEIVGASVRVSNAVLTADEKGGKLSYTGGIGDAAASQNESVALAFQALEDFHFSILELGLDGNVTGEMLVTMKMLGLNPDVLEGQPFDFNIGLTSDLEQLLRSRSYYGGQHWLADVVAEQVRENTEPQN